jgi:hypothetical protein
MATAIVEEWRVFRRDSPGQRFENHYQRMRLHGSRGGAIARSIAGVLLVVLGLVMLVAPGPGIIVTLFGLGLLGGQSKTLARGLDRVEPELRRLGRGAKRWWKLAPWPMRGGVLGIAIVLCGTVAFAVLA